MEEEVRTETGTQRENEKKWTLVLYIVLDNNHNIPHKFSEVHYYIWNHFSKLVHQVRGGLLFLKKMLTKIFLTHKSNLCDVYPDIEH